MGCPSCLWLVRQDHRLHHPSCCRLQGIGVAMTKEALKMALEALETPWNAPYVDGCDLALGKKVKAITAIKEALVNEALDKMAENARELGLDYEPEQEPVTCVEYIPCCTDQTCSKCKAATPPQRTWVGLTNEEIKKIVGSDRYTDLLLEVVNFVEAKLKEKNT